MSAKWPSGPDNPEYDYWSPALMNHVFPDRPLAGLHVRNPFMIFENTSLDSFLDGRNCPWCNWEYDGEGDIATHVCQHHIAQSSFAAFVVGHPLLCVCSEEPFTFSELDSHLANLTQDEWEHHRCCAELGAEVLVGKLPSTLERILG